MAAAAFHCAVNHVKTPEHSPTRWQHIKYNIFNPFIRPLDFIKQFGFFFFSNREKEKKTP